MTLPAAAREPLLKDKTMDLREFQDVNAARGNRWHHGNLLQWSLLEWSGAMAGEAGEACNVAKKLRRLDKELPNREAGLSVVDSDALRAQLAREVADTVIYGLLIMSALGVDASEVIASVFDRKSIEYGFPERAPLAALSPSSGPREAQESGQRHMVSEVEVQSHRPWCRSRRFGNIGPFILDDCSCDASAPAQGREGPEATALDALFIDRLLAEYPDELDKAACDRCEQCRPVGTSMCSFHSLISVLLGHVPLLSGEYRPKAALSTVTPSPEASESGIALITDERYRQITREGYSAAHDDGHDRAEMAVAAAALCVDGTNALVSDEGADNADDPWGLVSKHRGQRVRQLVIAGALVAAEIDRVNRRPAATPPEKGAP